MRCWGRNSYRQLGDGTQLNRSTPVAVSGLGSGARQVSTGEYHSCALDSSSLVRCWGQNTYGQLGDGSTTDRLTPVVVAGLGTVRNTPVGAGINHSCAINAANRVLCWGTNASGQLGDGTTPTRLTPVPVSGLNLDVVSLSTNYSQNCAVTSAGAVRCWGYNNNGQLGDGSTTNRLVPVAAAGLTAGITDVTLSWSHSCALTSAGYSRCWGSNAVGTFGDGTTNSSYVPVEAP